MSTPGVSTFVLVVLEQGSPWPAHLDAAADNFVILQQAPQERRAALLRPSQDSIRRIERAGDSVGTAVLSCNDDASPGVLEDRAPLARALLAAILRGGNGRLELLARFAAPNRVKLSLVGLAGTLTEPLAGTSVAVSARFVESSRGGRRNARSRRAATTIERPPPRRRRAFESESKPEASDGSAPRSTPESEAAWFSPRPTRTAALRAD